MPEIFGHVEDPAFDAETEVVPKVECNYLSVSSGNPFPEEIAGLGNPSSTLWKQAPYFWENLSLAVDGNNEGFVTAHYVMILFIMANFQLYNKRAGYGSQPA